MRGIVLAGGGGSRLYPATKSVSKQLLAVYDKPMIYYPISHLVSAGIREILVISTPRDLPAIEALLGDGANLGLKLQYAEQASPRGIAEAFLIGKRFIGAEPVTLILGDNIFLGPGFGDLVRSSIGAFTGGAEIYLKRVADPSRFGVADIDGDGTVRSIVEKPERPRSDLAVTGLYTYDARVVGIAERLNRSDRGELEITDINRTYLEFDELRHHLVGPDIEWIDMGTPDALVRAANAVQRAYHEQGESVGSVEIASYRRGYISAAHLGAMAAEAPSEAYAQLLRAELDRPADRDR